MSKMTDTPEFFDASDDFGVEWKNFCAEQTPENLRIDKKGKRAWGYKRFTLANLFRFARRCKGRVIINSPFIIIAPDTSGDDLSDEELDAFCSSGTAISSQRGITQRILTRLTNNVGRDKADKCENATKAQTCVPQGKLSFRYTAPLGGNGPVCLLFRITNFALNHETLENLYNSVGVRNVIVTLAQNVTVLKVVVR